MPASVNRLTPRLGISSLPGVVAGIVAGVTGLGLALAVLVGWITFCVVFVAWTWRLVWPMDGEATRAHAAPEDSSPGLAETLVVVASVVSLGAVGLLMVGSAEASGWRTVVDAVVTIGSVVLSFTIVHTLYALRYARLYYDDASRPAVDFDQDDGVQPRYSDFAYLAFTLGMTYQVSDTDLHGVEIRRVVLQHTLLSYLFGTVVLASTINLVVSLSGS